MTITEHFFGNSSTQSVSFSEFEYEAEVFIRSDDPQDTGPTVINYLLNNGFQFGSSYSVGNDFIEECRLYQIDKPALFDGCLLWRTVVHYHAVSPKRGSKQGSDGNDKADDPTDFRPSLSINTVTRQVPVGKATYLGGYRSDGPNPPVPLTVGQDYYVTNSALTAFLPQPKKDTSNRVIRITRNLAAVVFDEANFPTDWINDTAVTLAIRKTSIAAEPYTLKFLRWSTTPKYEENIDYVEVGLEMEYRKKGWREEFLDQGVVAKAQPGDPDGKGGTVSSGDVVDGVPAVRQIADVTGNDISDPVPFDGAGQPLDLAQQQYSPVYSTWGFYDEINPLDITFLGGIASETEE